MNPDFLICEPFQFNLLKHHLGFIRQFISEWCEKKPVTEIKILVKELKHIGTSVMDVYTGNMTPVQICSEIKAYLESQAVLEHEEFSGWAGKYFSDFREFTHSDTSKWILKFHDDIKRYVHIFPSRQSPYSFRVKANTFKSAILYIIIIGKDYISRRDLNLSRSLLGLSPVKDPEETEAITELIEILRN